jgi:hypothetical protein
MLLFVCCAGKTDEVLHFKAVKTAPPCTAAQCGLCGKALTADTTATNIEGLHYVQQSNDVEPWVIGLACKGCASSPEYQYYPNQHSGPQPRLQYCLLGQGEARARDTATVRFDSKSGFMRTSAPTPEDYQPVEHTQGGRSSQDIQSELLCALALDELEKVWTHHCLVACNEALWRLVVRHCSINTT